MIPPVHYWKTLSCAFKCSMSYQTIQKTLIKILNLNFGVDYPPSIWKKFIFLFVFLFSTLPWGRMMESCRYCLLYLWHGYGIKLSVRNVEIRRKGKFVSYHVPLSEGHWVSVRHKELLFLSFNLTKIYTYFPSCYVIKTKWKFFWFAIYMSNISENWQNLTVHCSDKICWVWISWHQMVENGKYS